MLFTPVQGQATNAVSMQKRFYLISTSHLEDRIWFQDEDDFKAAMNMVAVAAYVCRIKVLNFILMSNHVHFVVQAGAEGARQFIDYFKLLYSKYMRNKYGLAKYLRGNTSDIRETSACNESLERAIAYVHMNCVAANICTHPSQYPWGCGSVFFYPRRSAMGVPLSSLSQRECIRQIHSNVQLPPDYMLTHEGFINPGSYVPVSFVENLFRSPKRFQFFLNNSFKAKNRMAMDAMPSFRDHVILSGLSDLCHSLFRKTAVEELSDPEKSEMLKQLRFRFSADLAQLSRVTGIPYPDVCSLVEAF